MTDDGSLRTAIAGQGRVHIEAGQLHESQRRDQIDQSRVDSTHRLLCLNRFGTAEEIGHACPFFASDAAAYVTGPRIPVSGDFGV